MNLMYEEMSNILNLTMGNPGAYTFVLEAYEYNPFAADPAFERMQCYGIVGDKLYMLWNDCCNRDTRFAIRVMRSKSIEEIERHINYEYGRGIRFEEEEDGQ